MGEALPAHIKEGNVSPFSVANAKRDPVGVAEIELGQMAVKVQLAAMLVNPAHPTQEGALMM